MKNYHFILTVLLFISSPGISQNSTKPIYNISKDEIVNFFKSDEPETGIGRGRNIILEKVPEKINPDSDKNQPKLNVTNTNSNRRALNFAIQFEYDSSLILPESRNLLLTISKALNEKDIKNHRFLLEGHTDAKGSQNYNLLLSKRRANSVKSFLIANGIAEQRLTVDGKGALDLIDPVNPYSASNRIVRLIDLR